MKSISLLLLLPALLPATEPDAATRRWWSHVQALSNDDLAGRDTGSEGYRKAAAYVVKQFEAAGLRPAGTNGWYQPVAMCSVRLRTDQSEAALVDANGAVQKLEWLRQITVPARTGFPESIDAPLVFEGTGDVTGKIMVRLNLGAGRRAAGAYTGAVAILTIDPTTGPEPPRWPVAYSTAVSLDANGVASGGIPLAFRVNPAAADLILKGSGHTYRELMDGVAAGKPLPQFDIPQRLRVRMKFETSELQSDNILGVLPGSDPALAGEYVVIGAHLDGYGIGEPWNGDRIYNGAFDDAAYVATLIDFAQQLKATGTKLKRSVLFAVWTGEEKGLLGSRFFTSHPTVPPAAMVANVNLDQLRPIFPLKLLTTLALDDSTLGATVRKVAGTMDIRVQPDPEPERNLLRRSDHWNFMGIGVPAVGFIFGYEKGTPEEAVYRRWYAERYHSPADDLKQPWVPEAAAKFNDFFGKVVREIAGAPERPKWNSASPYAKSTATAMPAPTPDFDQQQAARFAALALDCVHKEYPNKIAHAMNSDADLKPPRELTPAFYGCYDWHSSVHGHWLLVRLARLFPQAEFAAKARAAVARDLTPANIAGEVKYITTDGRTSFERPYGLAWLLQLAAELREWDDPQARDWAAALRPLETAVIARISSWLPKLSHPIRTGEHNNTAFGLGLMLDYASVAQNREFRTLLESRARDYYGRDQACPLNYEPSGEDFLSPCLAEADVMRRVLPPAEFLTWFNAFLPKIELEPTRVIDPTDGKLYHLAGLNLSRAWMLKGIVSKLPPADPRRKSFTDLAVRLRQAGLESIKSEHYEGGHWLGTFAAYQ